MRVIMGVTRAPRQRIRRVKRAIQRAYIQAAACHVSAARVNEPYYVSRRVRVARRARRHTPAQRPPYAERLRQQLSLPRYVDRTRYKTICVSRHERCRYGIYGVVAAERYICRVGAVYCLQAACSRRRARQRFAVLCCCRPAVTTKP